jgi:hypothetical protein
LKERPGRQERYPHGVESSFFAEKRVPSLRRYPNRSDAPWRRQATAPGSGRLRPGAWC